MKDATKLFNRMGGMGNLPTSAWLRLWKYDGVGKVLAEVCRFEASPTVRAALLVEQFESFYRVGRKIATLFVSTLSTPVLAPGFTPWFPDIDGNEFVVVDTNVARAVDMLREKRGDQDLRRARTVDARTGQPCRPARVPFRSARVLAQGVQQALYALCSRSNRLEHRDPCSQNVTFCEDCSPLLCPFSPQKISPKPETEFQNRMRRGRSDDRVQVKCTSAGWNLGFLRISRTVNYDKEYH